MLQTFTAKTIGLVRPLAPLLLGAMLPLLSLLASANAEAQTEFTPPQVTIHIKANLTREATRPPPSYNWSELALRFTRTEIIASVTTCFQKGRRPDTETLACPDQVAQAAQPATLELDGREDLRSSQLCALMGGDVKLQGRQEVCSNIDQAGTFCFVGSREVFPCGGLYRRALTCNSFNRPARNPFICESACEDGHFACGSGCWSVNFEPTDEVFPVAPEYEGNIFAVETTLTVGTWEFAIPESPQVTLDDVIWDPPSSGKSFGLTAQVSSSPLPAESAHAETLQVAFYCPELSTYKHVAVAEWPFTVTVLAQPPTTTLYFESSAGTGGGGSVTVHGITALAFYSGDATLFQVGEDGEISLSSPRPGDGESRTLTVLAYSPEEFLGAMRLTVQAEFRHPFDSDLGAGHCRVPAASDYQALRQESCSGDAVDGYCAELDDPLFDALETDGVKGDSDFCRALRDGANVNALDFARDYPYPMAAAAKGNSVARGEILLRDGALIRNRAERGDALNYAAYAGAADFARWLIATAGAGVNASSGPGTTPIFHARTSEMVNLLVSAGANVNFITESPPRTPLDAMLDDYDFAANAGLLQAIERLEREGAQCLASFTRPRPSQILSCANQPACELPDLPHPGARSYFSLCTLECPGHYANRTWACEGSAFDIINSLGQPVDEQQNRALVQCQDRAVSLESDLSCL